MTTHSFDLDLDFCFHNRLVTVDTIELLELLLDLKYPHTSTFPFSESSKEGHIYKIIETLPLRLPREWNDQQENTGDDALVELKR